MQQSINSVATGQERGFANMAYETQRQTCDIRDAIRENTAQVLAGQQAAEMRELNRDIAERDRKIAEQAVVINNGQQNSYLWSDDSASYRSYCCCCCWFAERC